jgi:hypothetical protein
MFYGGLKPTQSSTPIDKLKGMDLGWFGIDEASEVPEEIFLILSGSFRLPLPNIHYRALLTSNPEAGWINERFIRKILPDHKFIPALPYENPHNPSDYESNLRELYPEDWIKRYIEGIWDFEENSDELHLFTYNMIENAMQRELPAEGRINLGVDFAGAGKDNSVIAKSRGGHNEILYKSSYTPDLMPFVGIIGSYIRDLNPEKVICDAVGIGSGPTDRLKEVHGKDRIFSFIGGQAANDDSKYKNRRAELHWTFRQKLIDGICDLPNNDIIKKQASAIKYKIYSDAKIQIEPKDDIKKRIGSPDDLEAIMMANYNDEESDNKIGRVIKWSKRS